MAGIGSVMNATIRKTSTKEQSGFCKPAVLPRDSPLFHTEGLDYLEGGNDD